MKRDGFSLVEILVVVSITTMLVGFGMASLHGFNRRERLKQAGSTIKSMLRLAQSKAISAEKPSSGCTTYIGVRVSFAIDSFTIQHTCDPDGIAGTPTTVMFSKGIEFAVLPSAFTFLQQNMLDTSSAQTLTITNGPDMYRLVVSPNGNVSDLGFVL